MDGRPALVLGPLPRHEAQVRRGGIPERSVPAHDDLDGLRPIRGGGTDEIAVRVGPEVVYNTFDQNRVFLGLEQTLGRSWSFDLGHVLVPRQKASGNEHDLNRALRRFSCFTPDPREEKSSPRPASGEEQAAR